MNLLSRQSPAPVRGRKPAGAAAQLLLRQGKPKDESLDLFSAIRRSESPTISSASAAAAAEEGMLGRRSGVDDDLLCADVGKSDYDWLLTPPGTPLFSSSNAREHRPSSASAKNTSRVRSASATKPSRFSASSPLEINTSTRSGRTSSAASSSVSSNCNSSAPPSTAKSSLLRRSSASVMSKPSPPSPRQTAMRPISAPAPARLPSPARSRHKPSPPSTAIARPSPVAPASRPNPRQSTPTRRDPARSASVARAAVQPDVMAKIKTKPAERPQSTGKQRSVTPAISNRARIQENSTKKANPTETKRPPASNAAIRISAKPSSPVESNGFGRNISKKSLNVAVRQADIRQGAGGVRGAALFPHSIRSTATKSHKAALRTTTTTTAGDNGSLDQAASECGSSTNGAISIGCAKTESSESGGDSTTSAKPQERKFTAARASELDLYGSTRYDTMLLKEDARNLNWLRGVDDVSAESPTFHRFEPLPEPFGLV